MIVYSGGTYVNATFTGDTIANIITALQTQLTNAGWSVSSGGGTTNLLMQSATQTGVTNPLRVRIKTNSGTCAEVSIENQAGTLASTSSTSAGGMLLPAASQTMRVIATKYWFACFVPGSSAARTFVYAGMPYVDASILAGVTDIGFMFSNAQSEGSSGALNSFRTNAILTGSNVANYAVIYNASLFQNNNSTGNAQGSGNSAGGPECIITTQPAGGQNTLVRAYRWASDAFLTSDVLVCWGLTALSDEAKIRGQFFDLIYISEAVVIDATDTFSGHTWFNLTNNGTHLAGQYPRGGMWVRTDT